MTKTHTLLPLALGALAAAGAAQAQEVGRVLQTTPVIQQVQVPRQVCNTQQVVTQATQPSGAGAAMGAIAGGALGNQIGGGSGRGVATVLGVVGGAILGNRIEGPSQPQVQNVQNCTTQVFYENRTVSYNVVYEFNGKQYTVNMPHDPGATVQLQVTPVVGSPATTIQTAPVQQAPVQTMPISSAPVTTTVVSSSPVVAAPAYVAAPVYAAPSYYPGYWAPPVSLSIGYVHRAGGWGHRHWH